ncbi:hypothetical protein BD769DRAFT_1660721 [Suillus cothurnatus]|nr:hypothetical protein BD769DRAFT_1660721 [Suillus cothurnatus]
MAPSSTTPTPTSTSLRLPLPKAHTSTYPSLWSDSVMESWDIKGKFIPSIKPILADVTLKTVNVEDIFNFMLVLFPYHFTMTKLIKHIIFADHLKFLTDRQDELLQQLAGLMKDRFSKVQEEWEKSVIT